MSEFKGTKENVVLGDEKYYNGNKAYEIWYGNDGECVAEVVHKIEDANLIVDAFKVRQQINCELSELLEQRNEMLWILQKIYDEKEVESSKDLKIIIEKFKNDGK